MSLWEVTVRVWPVAERQWHAPLEVEKKAKMMAEVVVSTLRPLD